MIFKSFSLIAFLAAALALPLHAAGDIRGNVGFTPVKVNVANDSMRIAFDVILDRVEIAPNAQLNLRPRLVSQDGTQIYEFAPVSVAGRTRYIMWERGDRKTPRPFSARKERMVLPVSITAPAVEWARTAKLNVEEQISGCASCELARRELTVSEQIFHSAYRPGYSLAYLTPKEEMVKMRSEKFVARFNFRVNRTELLPELGNNSVEFARVDSVANAILGNKDITVRAVSIDGYASPEGIESNNIRLANERAKSFVHYLEQTYGISTRLFQIQGHGEDWDGLRRWLSENSYYQWSSPLLNILDGTRYNTTLRKDRMKQLGNGDAYAFLMDNVFPELRRTEYKFTYQVRSFNEAEAIELNKSNPYLLSLAELYKVGNSFPEGSAERRGVFETAYRLFPQEPVSRFNAIAANLASGKTTGAEYLLNFPTSAEQLNNLGVYYALTGNYLKAAECFQRAGRLPQALKNLEELNKAER